MASSNLEIVREIYAAWGQGDFSSTDWADPELEMVAVDGPAPMRAIGLDEVSAAWSQVLNAWRDFRAEAEEIRELDPERVLVLTRNRGRGRSSGVEVGSISARGANLFYLRDGKVTRLVTYWDRERAFDDLGLASEPDV